MTRTGRIVLEFLLFCKVFEPSTGILRTIIRDDNIRNARPRKHWFQCDYDTTTGGVTQLCYFRELGEKNQHKAETQILLKWKRSVPTFSHSLSGTGCESSGSLGLLFRFSLQVGQWDTISSMCIDMCGQYKTFLALPLHLTIPKCDSWILFSISCLSWCGTMSFVLWTSAQMCVWFHL